MLVRNKAGGPDAPASYLSSFLPLTLRFLGYVCFPVVLFCFVSLDSRVSAGVRLGVRGPIGGVEIPVSVSFDWLREIPGKQFRAVIGVAGKVIKHTPNPYCGAAVDDGIAAAGACSGDEDACSGQRERVAKTIQRNINSTVLGGRRKRCAQSGYENGGCKGEFLNHLLLLS